jgi:hypothetical protein
MQSSNPSESQNTTPYPLPDFSTTAKQEAYFAPLLLKLNTLLYSENGKNFPQLFSYVWNHITECTPSLLNDKAVHAMEETHAKTVALFAGCIVDSQTPPGNIRELETAKVLVAGTIHDYSKDTAEERKFALTHHKIDQQFIDTEVAPGKYFGQEVTNKDVTEITEAIHCHSGRCGIIHEIYITHGGKTEECASVFNHDKLTPESPLTSRALSDADLLAQLILRLPGNTDAENAGLRSKLLSIIQARMKFDNHPTLGEAFDSIYARIDWLTDPNNRPLSNLDCSLMTPWAQSFCKDVLKPDYDRIAARIKLDPTLHDTKLQDLEAGLSQLESIMVDELTTH